jgi:hypothetical protein
MVHDSHSLSRQCAPEPTHNRSVQPLAHASHQQPPTLLQAHKHAKADPPKHCQALPSTGSSLPHWPTHMASRSPPRQIPAPPPPPPPTPPPAHLVAGQHGAKSCVQEPLRPTVPAPVLPVRPACQGAGGEREVGQRRGPGGGPGGGQQHAGQGHRADAPAEVVRLRQLL